MTIRRKYWNDGEGIVHGDLNDISTFLRETFLDNILKGYCQDGIEYAVGLSTDKAYALAHSGSVVSVEGLKTRTYSGVVFFYDGTNLLAFNSVGGAGGTFAGTFSTSGLTAGQSRWDLCVYRLAEYDGDSQSRDVKEDATGVIGSLTCVKQKQVQCPVNFVQGTPDTTVSAVEPATPAGYAKLYAVRVDYGQTGVFAAAQLRDYRYPLGYHEQLVRPAEMFQSAAGGWAYTGNEVDIWKGTGGGAGDIWIPYKGPLAARAILLCVSGMPGNGTCTTDIGYFTRSGQSTGTFTAILAGLTNFKGGTGAERYVKIAGDDLVLWGNGKSVPDGVNASASQLMARIYSDDAAGYIHQAKWGYAGF